MGDCVAGFSLQTEAREPKRREEMLVLIRQQDALFSSRERGHSCWTDFKRIYKYFIYIFLRNSCLALYLELGMQGPKDQERIHELVWEVRRLKFDYDTALHELDIAVQDQEKREPELWKSIRDQQLREKDEKIGSRQGSGTKSIKHSNCGHRPIGMPEHKTLPTQGFEEARFFAPSQRTFHFQ